MPSPNVKKIAVIGAGPKAAAIVAKASCLPSGVFRAVDVEVFEETVIGAAWTGQHGYTDGEQHLCTPAERDLGFPYLHSFTPGLSADMQARFSWGAFLMARDEDYLDWVNRGRQPPTHRQFADYLRFAFDAANVVPSYGRVVGIRRDKKHYVVTQVQAVTGATIESGGFDGVAFTGTGPAQSKLPPITDPDVLDGVSFWSNLPHVAALMSQGSKHVVIIGGGGTAAAVSAWFTRKDFPGSSMEIVNTQAVLFTRTANFFESRLFEDQATWDALSPTSRRTFVERLNRGVVWETVTDLLSHSNRLSLTPGRALAMIRTASPTQPLEITIENALGKSTIEADLVIDTTGFDAWHFVDLLPSTLRARLSNATKRADLARRMRSDLSLPIYGHSLHVPAVSDQIGPGYMSLMALGGMADRILRPYA